MMFASGMRPGWHNHPESFVNKSVGTVSNSSRDWALAPEMSLLDMGRSGTEASIYFPSGEGFLKERDSHRFSPSLEIHHHLNSHSPNVCIKTWQQCYSEFAM